MEIIYVQLEQNNYTIMYSQMEMLFIVIVRTPQRTPYNLDYRVRLQQYDEWMKPLFTIIHYSYALIYMKLIKYFIYTCMQLNYTLSFLHITICYMHNAHLWQHIALLH